MTYAFNIFIEIEKSSWNYTCVIYYYTQYKFIYIKTSYHLPLKLAYER